MDKLEESNTSTEKRTTWEKREEFEDGSYCEEKVEKVSNGYIRTKTTHYKKGEEWKYDCVKSIHEDNPMEDKSVVDKLREALKNY